MEIVKAVSLKKHFNWPLKKPKDPEWRTLAEEVLKYPKGKQKSWGITFEMSKEQFPCVLLVSKNLPEVKLKINDKAAYI